MTTETKRGLRTMTRATILALRDRVAARKSKVMDAVIAAGLGALKYSDLRSLTSPPEAVELVGLYDEHAEICYELERRMAFHGTHHRTKDRT